MIQFRHLALARGARRLIENATLQIHPGWRVGLVGANGSGKSSLFALLRGELHADHGDCEVPARWLIASVAQDTPALATARYRLRARWRCRLRAIEHELAGARGCRGSNADDVIDGHRRVNCTRATRRSTVTARGARRVVARRSGFRRMRNSTRPVSIFFRRLAHAA